MTQMPFNTALDFTRASAATARTATGKIQEVLTDEQRLVGNREGLLIEEQRTNFIEYSNDFLNAYWSRYDEKFTFEDMGEEVWKITTVSGQGSTQFGKLDNGSDFSGLRTLTLEFKMGSQKYVTLGARTYWYTNNVIVNLETLDVLEQNAILTARVLQLEDGWVRVSMTTDNDGDSRGFFFGFTNAAGDYLTGTGQEYFYVRRPQLEKGSFPTSYIPTAGAQVTRAADDCVRVLGDEFNADEYTIFVDVSNKVDFNNDTIYDSSESPHRLQLRVSNGTINLISLPDNNINISLGAYAEGSRIKVGVSLSKKLGLLQWSYNGSSGSESITQTAIDQLFFGARPNGGERGSFTYKGVTLFPTALSDAELITLTGGT